MYNNSERELAVKACEILREIFLKGEKNITEEYPYSTVLKYLDLFIGDDISRGFLMDRIFDLILDLGKAQFNSPYQY